MSSLAWNIIIVSAVVMIFIIFIRRLPRAKKYLVEEKRPEMAPEKIASYGLLAQANDAYEAKNFDLAEELYIKIASQEPNNAKVYSHLGLIYLDQNNYYDAKESFLQSIKLEPDIASRHASLGLAYLGLKDFFKATQTFVRAVELEPKEKKYRALYEKAQKLLEREKKRKK